MTPRKLSYVNGRICYIRHAWKVAYSYPKASWGLDSLCASRFQTSKASSKEKLMLTCKSLSTCVYFLSSYRSYQLVSFCSTAINQLVSLLLLLQNRIWSKPTSCLTLSVVMASAPQRILVPFFYFPWSYCCCWVLSFCWNALWFFTISGGVNFNRQLDSVNLNSLPTKKRFLFKKNPELQRFSQFLRSFSFDDSLPLWCSLNFAAAWCQLQYQYWVRTSKWRLSLPSLHPEWEMSSHLKDITYSVF